MNKIMCFEEWRLNYPHPFPDFKPFEYAGFNKRNQHEDADAYVQVNIQHPYIVKEPGREPIYEYIKSTGKPSVVFETAVFREGVDSSSWEKSKYHRFSWDSYLFNEGDFGPVGNPDDRWKRIQKEQGIEIRPWRANRGKYVLILLQHVIDTSLVRMMDQYDQSYYKWLKHTISLIRANTDLPIHLRPHPKHGMYGYQFEASKINSLLSETNGVKWSVNPKADKLHGGRHLMADLMDAHAVVGWTSNAMTEAACYGIPVYAMSDGAMSTPVSHTDFTKIDNVVGGPDRQQWLNDMAYSQWTHDEIKQGVAWNHITKER